MCRRYPATGRAAGRARIVRASGLPPSPLCGGGARAIVHGHIERRRRHAHGAEKSGSLAAMMRTVIDYVRDHLPDRLVPLIAADIAIVEIRRRGLIGQPASPLLPLFLEA